MGGVGPFVAGILVGVVGVILFVAVNAARPIRFIAMLIHVFQLMRLHLGRNSLVAASTTPYGWKISFHCFGCKHVSIIKPVASNVMAVPTFKCEACGKSFKETGNDAGGAGVNGIDVTEEAK
jgi:hypothetical protein